MNLINVGKPIAALCVSPVVLALAMKNNSIPLTLSIGSTKENSPYDILDFQEGIKQTGAAIHDKNVREILIDHENKIVCAPCYMMDASILDVRLNVQSALLALKQLV